MFSVLSMSLCKLWRENPEIQWNYNTVRHWSRSISLQKVLGSIPIWLLRVFFSFSPELILFLPIQSFIKNTTS